MKIGVYYCQNFTLPQSIAWLVDYNQKIFGFLGQLYAYKSLCVTFFGFTNTCVTCCTFCTRNHVNDFRLLYNNSFTFYRFVKHGPIVHLL